jgi:hypothetical protein
MSVRPTSGLLKPETTQEFGTTPAAVSLKSGYANCIWVGATGTIAITTDQGTRTFTGISPGIWHPMQNFTAISAITSATGVIAGQTK